MFDVANDLRERFDFNAYWFQSAWEHDPAMEIINNTITGRDPNREVYEDKMIEIFECLRDSVEAIPTTAMKDLEKFYVSVGAEKYEEIVIAAIQSVSLSGPKSAAEFIESIKLSATNL